MLYIRDLMTSPVFTLLRSDTLKDARALLELARIRHIPIVDEQEMFQGLITHRDVLAATISRFADITSDEQSELDMGIPIATLMRTDVLTASPDMPLKEAAKLLLTHRYGCLPVVENGKLTGIITEADFLRLTLFLFNVADA